MRLTTRKRSALLLTAATGLVLVLACGGPVERETQEAVDDVRQAVDDYQQADAIPVLVARANLISSDDSLAAGTVTFTESLGQVTVKATITGVTPVGKHGLHVHETGDCTPPDYTGAGGHFNPTGTDHGCPPANDRHSGDLGNIVIGEDGSGILELLNTDLLSVSDGPLSVVGKAIILHEGEDDCTTQPTGDAGGRIACGVIALVPTEPTAAAGN